MERAQSRFYWSASPEAFYRLHDVTVDAIRRALPTARVGGPDLAGAGGTFMDGFLRHVTTGTNYATGGTGTPTDFLSFHAKGQPAVVDGHVRMGIANQLRTADEAFANFAAVPELAGKPIVIGENDPEGCAACPGPANAYRNGPLYASYTAASYARLWELAQRRGTRLEGALAWSYTFVGQPWFAGYRQLATNGVDLAVLNVFRLFARLGPERLDARERCAGAARYDAARRGARCAGCRRARDAHRGGARRLAPVALSRRRRGGPRRPRDAGRRACRAGGGGAAVAGRCAARQRLRRVAGDGRAGTADPGAGRDADARRATDAGSAAPDRRPADADRAAAGRGARRTMIPFPGRGLTVMPRFRVAALAALLALTAGAGPAQVWRSDQGDGSFRNPVLYADYPDPDVIRVGRDYYLASTTFANVPGITILHSRDLINWTIASHLVDRLEGLPQYDLKGGNAYRKGLYASSLRYHDGTYYLANTPVGQKTRIWYARDVRGPWRYHELEREAFDPGLFIEPDGRAYLATASTADGTITLLTLDATLAHVTDARRIHYIKGAEGSKIIRRGDYYYLFNALPPRLALSVSRSRSLFGPWETRDQIDDKSGGHQGALVDLPDGRWFGFVMEDSGAIGRMTNMSPVFWQDDWPVWGTPAAPGRVPRRAAKPIPGAPFAEPATSDDFSAPRLGLQWQWNHNPDPARWSLTQRPGWLRLRPTVATRVWSARNTLTQKGQGPASRGEVKLDIGIWRPATAAASARSAS